MKFLASIALLSGMVALGVAPGAAAQSAQGVEHSGRVFHVKVCPGPDVPGMMRCHAHVVTDSRGNILTFSASRNVAPGGYSPSQLRGAYSVTGSGSSSTTVAIVDAYGYPNAASDLAVYRAQFNLPACTTASGCLRIVSQTGTSKLPKANAGWDQEQALDLDMVSAMCPGCRILLVQATSASDANLGTAVNTAVALGAHVVSNSYGGGESGAASYDAYYTHPGVAITASTGDSGYGVEYPASSPHVTAVGGTSLTISGTTRTAETAWSGGGSGCSTVFMAPSWQVGTIANSTCKARMEADVSAVADPNTGVAVYGPPGGTRSAWMVFGGTSVAAPLVGGLYGLNAGAVNYGQQPYLNTGALNDVTSGSNGSCKVTYYCTAGAGYDGPTGLGTPIGDTAF